MFAGLDNIFMTAYSACTASIINSNKLIICRNDLPIPLVVAMDPAQTKIDGCEAFNQPAWNWVENISQAFWHIICSLRDTRVLSFSQLERHQWAGVSNHPSSKAATVAIFMALVKSFNHLCFPIAGWPHVSDLNYDLFLLGDVYQCWYELGPADQLVTWSLSAHIMSICGVWYKSEYSWKILAYPLGLCCALCTHDILIWIHHLKLALIGINDWQTKLGIQLKNSFVCKWTYFVISWSVKHTCIRSRIAWLRNSWENQNNTISIILCMQLHLKHSGVYVAAFVGNQLRDFRCV